MAFSLFSKKKKSARDPWSFTELGDYWRVVQILEDYRQTNRPEDGMSTFFHKITPLILSNVDEYVKCIEDLDRLAEGIYRDVNVAKKSGIRLPQGMTLLDNVYKQGDEVRGFLNQIQTRKGDSFRKAWENLIDNPKSYIKFLAKLVQDFGNFEVLIVQLPGLRFPERPEVQRILYRMFEINTMHIRLLEMISDIRKAWKKGRPTTGFFKPNADFGEMVKAMVHEYMVESDPVRKKYEAEKAKAAGRPVKKYRFWRPAETLRQMAQVEYTNDQLRNPRQTRNYVKIDIKGKAPAPICADMQRLEWSIKEVFNNSVAATSEMMKTKSGLVARPLDRHNVENPPAAITLSVEPYKKKIGWFKKEDRIKLVIHDDGVGMEHYVSSNAHLWAFSSRRAEFGGQKGGNAQALIIGGKGIGLAFATALVEQHGGTLSLTSEEGVGTTVIFDLPIPTPYTLA